MFLWTWGLAGHFWKSAACGPQQLIHCTRQLCSCFEDLQEIQRSLERQARVSWKQWHRVHCKGLCLGRVGLDRPDRPKSCKGCCSLFGKAMTAVIESLSTGYFESLAMSGLIPVIRSASLLISVIVVSIHPSRDQSCFGIWGTITW